MPAPCFGAMWIYLPRLSKIGKWAWGLTSIFATLLGVAGWRDDATALLGFTSSINPVLAGLLMGAGGMGIFVFVAARWGEQFSTWNRFQMTVLRSWLKARSSARVVCLTVDLDTKRVQRRVVHVRLNLPSLIEFPYAASPKYCVQVPHGYRIEFEDDERYYVPRDFAMWPEESVRYILVDRPAPKLARCKITVHWVGQ